ncbi:DUF3626 domain-containing protein [Nocardioides palaemonis]|uniref:DUF3626 domain-containing protein n=1 Tax=Nocardioides palaemonis TaxID=2829810 RepID=UPI0027DDED4E|nr:DUF3626 domain-containing protein [Nocardioides palaemonis]
MPSTVLHFHPGWPSGSGTVLDAVVRDGCYRSQWVTGTSNGGLTAHPGGDRWRWESRIFDGRYDGARPEDRPVYGAWNRRDDAYGAASRFGSAYLRLRPHTLGRTTFCWPDSVFGPRASGGPEALGELCRLADTAPADRSLLPASAEDLPLDDPLDDYVEAHVHGGLVLASDVEAVVLDPSDDHARADAVARLEDLGVVVEHHPGYQVTAAGIDPDYRGAVPIVLARRLGGVLTPARLGAAAGTGDHDPQAVKWLWHCLARFGRVDG